MRQHPKTTEAPIIYQGRRLATERARYLESVPKKPTNNHPLAIVTKRTTRATRKRHKRRNWKLWAWNGFLFVVHYGALWAVWTYFIKPNIT